MPESPLWISEADVVALMDMRAAIDALEAGLVAEARGAASNMTKTHVEWQATGGHATLHAIGAVFAESGIAGTKTWVHSPLGATPLLILFNANDGRVNAIIEAFALGQLRTGAASGIATRLLASESAKELALIGTGKQSLTQVATCTTATTGHCGGSCTPDVQDMLAEHAPQRPLPAAGGSGWWVRRK